LVEGQEDKENESRRKTKENPYTKEREKRKTEEEEEKKEKKWSCPPNTHLPFVTRRTNTQTQAIKAYDQTKTLPPAFKSSSFLPAPFHPSAQCNSKKTDAAQFPMCRKPVSHSLSPSPV